jgi:hypothetical protein
MWRLRFRLIFYFLRYNRTVLLLRHTPWWGECQFWFRWSSLEKVYFIELNDIGMAKYFEYTNLPCNSLDICLVCYLLFLKCFHCYLLTCEDMDSHSYLTESALSDAFTLIIQSFTYSILANRQIGVRRCAHWSLAVEKSIKFIISSVLFIISPANLLK